MSEIELNGMQFYSHHGCFEQERVIGTHFRVDLLYRTDTAKAELSDDIVDAVSYLDVYRTVKREMETPSHLLEHVARRIGKAVLSAFEPIEEVSVRVCKLAPPLGGQVESAAVKIDVRRG